MHTEIGAYISPLREVMGNAQFMKQLERDYAFPVSVYQENQDGTRELVRVENPYS